MYLAVGVISGRLSDKYGCLPFTTGGLALTSVSLVLLSTVSASTSYLQLLAYMLVLGTGLGIFASPNISSIMGCVPLNRKGVASALRNTMFNVGYTVSLNLAVLLMTFTIPYAQLTQMITSLNPITITEAEKLLFAEGIQNTYVWLAVLNTAAILPSVLRGKRASGN